MWICPDCRTIYTERAESCERDDAPLAEVQAHQTRSRYPLLGKVVGERYHLIGGLGQGGLGTVYLAQHMHLGQLFAVKFLDVDSLVDQDKRQKQETRRDFLKEARVASLIRHDAVVRVSDFGEHESLPFLVMEYVPGPSLLHVLSQRGRFSEEEAISIARRVAEALDAFHERRLVHRDLKPANVILDPRGDGRLTLVDLGLVKDLSGPGGRASTHPLALRGTPGYLAPEQVPGWVLSGAGVNAGTEKGLVDARVDIYALGVILYEMLAGVSPYPDGSNTQIIVYCCTKDPIPLSEVHPPVRLRPGLEELVYATMSRHPDERPQTAADFLERLDAVAMGVTASRTSWPALVLPRSDRVKDSVGGLLLPVSGPKGPGKPTVTGPVIAEAMLSVDLEATQVFDHSDHDHDAEDATIEAPADSFDALLDRPLADDEDLLDVSQATALDPLGGLGDLEAEVPEGVTQVSSLSGPVDAAVEAALRPSVRGRPDPEPPPPPLRMEGRRGGLALLIIALLVVGGGLAAWLLIGPAEGPDPVPGIDANVTPVAVRLNTQQVDAEPTQAIPAVPAADAAPLDAAPPPVDAAPASDAGAARDAAPTTRRPKRPRRVRRPKPKAPTSGARPAKDELATLLRFGRNAVKQRRYDAAVEHYARFLKKAPRDHREYEAVRNRLRALRKRVKAP